MSDTDATGLWPKPDTLAAGDEAGVKTSRDYLNSDWPKARPYQEDGHLAADDHHRRHPNG